MFISNRLRKRKLPRQANRPPSLARLRFEQLEDRCLLTAGFLDPTFDGDGIVTTNVGQSAYGGEQVNAVALQPDGKIIAAGVTSTETFRGGYNKIDTAVVRYNADGTPDNTFGDGGKTITSFGGNIESNPTDVAVQSDGKIVVSGTSSALFTPPHFAVARYNANGSLDTNFGGKALGMVTTSILNKNSDDRANAMELQVDGKIVLAGGTRPQISSTHYGPFDVALVRYKTDGSLDTTFGGDGIVTTHFSSSASASSMAIYPSGSSNAGKILVTAGGMVVRYNSDGSLDTTFNGGVGGTPGYVTLSGVGSLTIQVNDDIVVAGTSQVNGTNPTHLALARLHSDGSLDTTFGAAGIVQTLLPNWGGSYVAFQPDGKIVVGWLNQNRSDLTQSKLEVARFNTNGSLDDGSANDSTPADSFGVSGIATSTGAIVSNFGGMALQTDGKIVMGGRAGLQATDFVLARFLGDDPPAALLAAAVSEPAVGQTLTRNQVEPLLTEAIARWQSAGVDVSSLRGIDVRIADLPAATLGLASGNTITLDANAAGWGWFIDSTPQSDSEFTTPGNQGEQNHMDLLTVVMHELGHLLGYEHADTGVMSATLATGIRQTPGDAATDWLFAHSAAEVNDWLSAVSTPDAHHKAH